MRYVCDGAPGTTWFQIESEAEALRESTDMQHAVETHFCRAREQASARFDPSGLPFIEQEIGRAAHLRRTMPVFLTLRDDDGTALVTAMLPPPAGAEPGFRTVLVGRGNSDPYVKYAGSIEALARHTGLILDRARCYPYRRD